MTAEATFLGADIMFGTRTMLFQIALLAIEAFGFALTLFLSALENQLIVMSFWSSTSAILPVRIWFWKRRRKPPDPTNLNKQSNIGTHPALPSHNNHCKRGRRTANNNFNLTSAAIRGPAPGRILTLHFFLRCFNCSEHQCYR